MHLENTQMARPEVTGRKMAATSAAATPALARGPPVYALDDADAYTIDEFCKRHRISVPMFYKRPDLMPRTFNIGKRRLISREAAARWRAEREAASVAEAQQ
jgi:hypothetical protein